MIDGIENAIITMTSSYYTLPPTQGMCNALLVNNDAIMISL